MEALNPADIIERSISQNNDEDIDRTIRRLRDILNAKNAFKNANDLTITTAKEKTAAWDSVKSLKMHPVYQDYKNLMMVIETLYRYFDEVEKIVGKA